MELSFDSAGLAALCSSALRMAEQWGSTKGRVVGRRLFDLRAVTAAAMGRIPTAVIAMDGKGETTITFADGIVIRGVVSVGAGAAAHSDEFLISSVDVQKGGSR